MNYLLTNCISFAKFCKYFTNFARKKLFVMNFSYDIKMNSHSSLQQKFAAVAQMTSTADKSYNTSVAVELIKKAKQKNCQIIFLPECTDYIASTIEESCLLAESINGNLIQEYQHLAKSLDIWISLGSFHEKLNINDKKVRNTHIVINNEGIIVSVYQKVHLFDVNLEELGISVMESNSVVAGDKISKPVLTPIGLLGLGICYDLRFPEFSQTLRNMNAEILSFPSAFTEKTGKDHWEILLRARAIETQCYIMAPAQIGKHNENRSSYGHAMIVNPWGTILAECKEATGLAIAEIDLKYLHSVRAQLPTYLHRRQDLYCAISSYSNNLPDDNSSFQFGQVVLKGDIIFAQTQHSIAFVNKKCILPGHVLVASRRSVCRLSDLIKVEISDLFCLVQKVERVVECIYNAQSSTIALQDGPDAGQSIKHVHVHIIPRNSYEDLGDKIYEQIQTHDKDDKNIRNYGEMIEECQKLRHYFSNLV